MDYWRECIECALEDCGLTASEEQKEIMAGVVEGAHENYGMAFGHDVATANYISDEARELTALKASIEKKRIWECETRPCGVCTTTGIVRDGWGRDQTCGYCNGEGRVK